MKFVIRFDGFSAKSGGTTDRVRFSISDGGTSLFSVMSGVTAAALSVVGYGEKRTKEALQIHVRRLLEYKLVSDPGWVRESRGNAEVTMDFDSFDVEDLAEIRRLVEASALTARALCAGERTRTSTPEGTGT